MVALNKPARMVAGRVAEFVEARYGIRPPQTTVARWASHGVMVGRERLRLPGLRVGGHTYYDPADVERFMDRLQGTTAAVPAAG